MNVNSRSDQAFLTRLTTIVEANLGNEQFGVNELAAKTGLSRSQIHRKLKSCCNKSVSQFIREIRLEKAKELLEDESLTSSEIAYKVGFGSPSYFIKSFHDYVGYPPSEYTKNSSEISENETTGNFTVSKKIKLIETGKSLKLVLFLMILVSTVAIIYLVIQNQKKSVIRNAEKITDSDTLLSVKYFQSKIFINSNPSGSSVYEKSFYDDDSLWMYLGESPLMVNFPGGPCLIKFEKIGYQSCTDVILMNKSQEEIDTIRYTLLPENEGFENMVFVKGQTIDPNLANTDFIESQNVGDFFIDKYEVTNEQYKKFIDDGGYGNRNYWPLFEKDGQNISWEEGISQFKDLTGWPGPSQWIAGSYPEAEDPQYPVSGISWYEAAAYAKYMDKNLPTIYHWSSLIRNNFIPFQIQHSNVQGTKPKVEKVPVKNSGIGKYGVYGLFGNVREWIFNNVNGVNYILGGGANDPDWYVAKAFTANPWNRDEFTGFRCISYTNESNKIQLEKSFENIPYDWSKEHPVGDDLFRHYAQYFNYEKIPVEIKSRNSTTYKEWIREIITVNSPYGNPDLEIHIIYPNNSNPPYQSLIICPGTGMYRAQLSRIDNLISSFEFILRTGRAIVIPRYYGAWERGTYVSRTDNFNEWAIGAKYRVIDVKRTIDYLEIRDDIDKNKIAYFGISEGSFQAPFLLATENRINLAILNAFGIEESPEDSIFAHINYLPRVKIPMLLFSGKFDLLWPYERQELFFNWLGTPEEQKKWICENGRHIIYGPKVQTETIQWLNEYLRPAINF